MLILEYMFCFLLNDTELHYCAIKQENNTVPIFRCLEANWKGMYVKNEKHKPYKREICRNY